ncbi:MAG: hypothetical protein ACXAES_03235, partial [Promethearchaeota archaeon]
ISASGYVSISSSSGTSINPGEIFTVSIQVNSFSEAQGSNIAVGFPSGSPGRGNNKDFAFDATQKSASIDGSGNSVVIDFQVTAPSTEQSYTLHADAIYRQGGSASYYAHGNLVITVEVQNIPPQFSNLIESADPLELGQTETFNINVTDSETSVNTVLIELESVNYTMTNILGSNFEYNWTPSTTGLKNYKIFANDTEGNWNSTNGTIDVIDTTIPLFSNLVESADPLELGQTETIQINVTDVSGISDVQIEIGGVNNSMINIDTSTWEYNTWIPPSIGVKVYTIYANDTEGNLNSISNDIRVIDTTSPTYNLIIESADPLPLGQNETISIAVYDSPGSGVKNVLLEYESTNHNMSFIGFDTWSWSNWQPTSVGTLNYTIYMIDNSDNLNETSGSIEVIISSGPTIQNLSKSADPLEFGENFSVQIDIIDSDGVSEVFIEIGGFNYTMTYLGGNKYNYSWMPGSTGTRLFKIYAADTLDNWNQIGDSVFVEDTIAPNYGNLTESGPIELGDYITISIEATDLSGINEVMIEFEGANHTMSYIGGITWSYNTWLPNSADTYLYSIYIQDMSNNLNSTSGSVQVIDTILPLLSNLIESADPLELGLNALIQINVTDISTIDSVVIEINGANYTMTNTGGEEWRYSNWIPSTLGVKTYTIYATDSNSNVNFLVNNITVIDTVSPILVNLIETTDPLELGDTASIQLDVIDFSPILFVLIEIEGSNYTLTNTAGNTWSYNNLTPTDSGIKFYRIFTSDSANNPISLESNITVVDTLGPVLTNLIKSDESILFGQSVSIQINAQDIAGVIEMLIEFEGSNHSMTLVSGNSWTFTNWTPSSTGEISFKIHAKDGNGNWNSIVNEVSVMEINVTIDGLNIKEYTNLAVISSIIGILVVSIVLIINTTKKNRFIK